jgi:pre-mRNA cleavage complex 2 protein Pcf11
MDREQTKATMRNWYLHPDDWMSFEGFQLSNQNEPLLVMKSDSREESVGKEEDKSTGISCPLLPGEDLGMCEICHEQLEQFWEEDEEDWHFKDTIRSSDGMLYHTYCFVDSKESHEMSTSFENENKPTTV